MAAKAAPARDTDVDGIGIRRVGDRCATSVSDVSFATAVAASRPMPDLAARRGGIAMVTVDG